MSQRLLILILVSALAACTTAPPRSTPAAARATPSAPAANDNLNAVAWTQTAIEHDLIYRQTYRLAGEKLLRALKNRNWDALSPGDRKNPARGLKPAVIVDIDETVLDNSPYQARLVRNNAQYNDATWAAWCRERKAAALPGALQFAQLANKHGVAVFYLSNRSEDLREATLDNLRSDGFPLALGEHSFLGSGVQVDGCTPLDKDDKSCRRQLIGRTYRVLLQLGDQLGDFVGVAKNTSAGRQDAIAPHMKWIGERWFVLPNPTYGSWQPALFNNDWKQPAATRRQAMLDALRN